MRQVTLSNIVYRIDKLNAFDQMELVRLGAPLGLQALIPLLSGTFRGTSEEEIIQGASFEMFVGFIERFAALNKSQWEEFRNLSLRLISRIDPEHNVGVPLVQQGLLMHEIELMDLFTLIYESIRENLDSFGKALPTLVKKFAPTALE